MPFGTSILLSFWHAISCCKDFYCWTQAAVFNTADKILNSNVSVPEEKACSTALRLMFQILSWSFKHTVEHENSDAKINSGLRSDAINLKKFERSLVKVQSLSYLHLCCVHLINGYIFYCSQGLCGVIFYYQVGILPGFWTSILPCAKSTHMIHYGVILLLLSLADSS